MLSDWEQNYSSKRIPVLSDPYPQLDLPQDEVFLLSQAPVSAKQFRHLELMCRAGVVIDRPEQVLVLLGNLARANELLALFESQ
jgi:hypothetical protein